jgi:transketolase
MQKKIATRQAYGDTLAVIGSDERIVVLDADVSKSTKSCGFAGKYPERFINMGIAEGNMIGVAAGLAAEGKIVFASTFAVFAALRACEQIRNSVCYPRLNVRIVGTHSGLSAGEDGATHQAVEDIAVMRSMPNMAVISPADAVETAAALKASLDYHGPVYFRLGRMPEPVIHSEGEYAFTWGKGEVLEDGGDVTLIATGPMVYEALEARKLLKESAVSARVINMHTIKPIDEALIVKAARETGAIVTCEEHSTIGGLGSAVAEVVAKNCPVPMGFVGIDDCFGKSGKPEDLKNRFGITKARIAEKALAVMENGKASRHGAN